MLHWVKNTNVYTPLPGVSSTMAIGSSPGSTRCCSRGMIPLSWCQSVFDGWVMAERLARWLQQWEVKGVSKIPLLPVHGDFSHASSIKWYLFVIGKWKHLGASENSEPLKTRASISHAVTIMAHNNTSNSDWSLRIWNMKQIAFVIDSTIRTKNKRY